MRKFVIWWGVNAISLFVVAEILPGVTVQEGLGTLLLVALVIGLVNAIVRPILYLMSCGLIVITLGLIIPVLNAVLLLLADSLAGGRFEVDNVLWAIIAAFLMGVINSVLNKQIEPDEDKKKKPHVIIAR